MNGAVVGQKSDALFVNELINTKYTSENDRRIAVSKKLERLNRQQLESIKNILQDNFSSHYTIPADNSAMGQRFVYWLGNAIDDRLGTLPHDRILEGHIGLIHSGTTVTNYAFTSTQGQSLIVTIGESSLEEKDGVIVYGYNWECFPGLVRLILSTAEAQSSVEYFVRKVSTVRADILPAESKAE